MQSRNRPLPLLRVITWCLLVTCNSFAATAAAQTSQAQLSQSQTDLDKEFASNTAAVNGIDLHYVRAGRGPALILIHGFPQDWFGYHEIMPRLARQFTVIAVDLRGIGGSTGKDGFAAASMAEDVYQLMAKLQLQHAFVVGHDIGGMVTYALVRLHPQALRGAMILDVPLPGIDGWRESLATPAAWHVGFMQVPGLAENLVAGRAADYFGYFFSFGKFAPDDVQHYLRAYATPAQSHAAFEIYRAFPANEQFNAARRGRNEVPLFIAFGQKSPFASVLPTIVAGLRKSGCAQVESALIPDAVHYLVEDQPNAVATLIERHAAIKK